MLRNSRLAFGLAVIGALLGACSDDETGPTDLTAPTGVAATQLTPTSVQVTWNAVPGASAYRLERASSGQPGQFTQVGGAITGTSYDDAGLTVGVTYSYRVAATAGTVTSAFSTIVDVTTGLAAKVLDANITQSRTLFADTVYTLKGYIKVQSGAVLAIQPGTRIIGDAATPGSSLWILRGARIEANGTAAQPIVFTSAKAPGQRKPGDWGGIVIIGNGVINRTGATILTEGGAAGIAENYAGGTNNADNSGTLRYVRIEFAGYDISNGGGQELNGLSMYAVGSGTRIEYVQTVTGLDDSFEWWGGAVDARYLVSYESGDDHFDWSEGYAGRVQFMIGLQTARTEPATGTGVLSTDPRGFEGDGCDPGVGGCIVTNVTGGGNTAGTSTPYSRPVFANFTLVGPGQLAGFPGDGNGAVFRRGTAGTFVNGIIARWPGRGLQMRDAFTDSLRLRDSLNVANIILAEHGAAGTSHYDSDGSDTDPALSESNRRFAQAGKFTTQNHRTGTQASALFQSLNTGSLDWTPKATAGHPDPTTGGSQVVPPKLAARVAGYPYTGGWVNTAYVGAAAPTGAKWWEGWTVFSVN